MADVPVVRVVQVLAGRLWIRQTVLPQFLLVEKIVVSFEVVDIPVVTLRLIHMVSLTIEIPELFVDMAVDVPVVWMQQVPQVTVQLQYIDKVVDVVVVQVVQERSALEACEASTGALLGHGGWNSSL